MQGDRIAAAACFLPLSVNPRSAAISARATAPRSASPKRTTPSRSSCPKRPARSRWRLGGVLERGLSADALRTRLRAPARAAPAPRQRRRGDAELARLMASSASAITRPEVASRSRWPLCSGSSSRASRSSSARCAFRWSSPTCPRSWRWSASRPIVVDVRVRGSSGALGRIATGELVAVLDLRSARPGQRLFHLAGRRRSSAVRRRGRAGDALAASPCDSNRRDEVRARRARR